MLCHFTFTGTASCVVVNALDRTSVTLVHALPQSRLAVGTDSTLGVLSSTIGEGVLAAQLTRSRALLGSVPACLAYRAIGDVHGTCLTVKSTSLTLSALGRPRAILVATSGAVVADQL